MLAELRELLCSMEVSTAAILRLFPASVCSQLRVLGRPLQAVMRVPAGTTHLLVAVGDAGQRTPGRPTSGATGGNASAIVALDANGQALALLVMSGGGGGAGVATVPK